MVFGWFKKSKESIDAEKLSNAIQRILEDYGSFIEKNPVVAEINDENKLPHDKEQILLAISVALKTTVTDENLRGALHGSAMMLALFQKGVGDETLYPSGIDMNKLKSLTSKDDLAAFVLSNQRGKERYDQLSRLVEADHNRIQQKLIEADRLYEKANRAR